MRKPFSISRSLPENKKHNRVLWLLNHKTLMPYEVPLLVQLGFEVFVPKILPNKPGFRSGSVSYEWDSTLSIPTEVLNLLNTVDFYETAWSPEVCSLLNRYFGTVFVMPFGVLTLEALRHFQGHVVFRAFGLENNSSYRKSLHYLYGKEIFERIKSAGDRFWFGVGYEQLKEIEPPLLASRTLFLPLGLPPSFWHQKGTWRGGSDKILFICPNLVTNPYYVELYQSFKSQIGNLPHVIVGAQDAPTTDSHVRGYVSDEELIELYQTSAGLYYPSKERRHLHYSPIEAMIVGTPVVFYDDCLLARLAGRKVSGSVKEEIEALEVMTALTNDSEEIRSRIRRDQENIPDLFSDEFCQKAWREAIQRSGLGKAGLREAAVFGLGRAMKQISQAFKPSASSQLESGREPVSRREIIGPLAMDRDPRQGIDFSLEELPLFVSVEEGLSEPDSWGRWSDGPYIRLCLETPLPKHFGLEIVGGAHGPNLDSPISVQCGDVVKTLCFHSPPWDPETQILHFRLKRPCSEIQIKIPHPTILVGGQRAIGIGLCKMKFLLEGYE